MTAEELIQGVRTTAQNQFPDDQVGRYAYQCGLLETKIRELLHRPILDLKVIDRGAWYGGPVEYGDAQGSNLAKCQAAMVAAEKGRA